MSFELVELSKIKPNRLNPRLEFDKKSLDELADSIKKHGLLQPLILRPTEDGFEVVVGERRYRAAQQAGLVKVPAIIREYTDDEVIELNLIENIQREDLSAVEKAKAIKQLRDKYPEKYPTWEAIAARIGVDVETVTSWVRTLNLPEELQRLIAPREVKGVPKGKIDYQTALHISERIKEPKKQVEIAKKFAEHRIPQRAARQILREIAKKPDKPVEKLIKEILETPPQMPFMPEHAELILKGKKTQTSRKGIDPKIKEGTIIEAYTKFAELKVTRIERKKLGEFTEEDARREGGYSLAEFKRVWKKLHGDWNPDETVYIIHFKLQKSYL